MKFRNIYKDEYEHFFSDPGSPIVILYEPEYNRDGHYELVEVGKKNIYDEIQSYKDSVDIHVILSRFVNGDTDALNQREGFYGDLSDIPGNLLDYINLVDSQKRNFERLPIDVRSKFGNSFAQFAAAAASGELASILADEQSAHAEVSSAGAEGEAESGKNVEVSTN